jgi:PEP-CTERM motif
MNLSIKGLALSAALVVVAQPAIAVTYDFRYQFTGSLVSNYGGPYIVTGSFDGIDDGVYVTDVTNVSAALDGVSFAGPLQFAATVYGPLTVSFILANNSFSIDNCALGDCGNGFFLRTPTALDQTDSAYTGYLTNSFQYVQGAKVAGMPPSGDWSLTARPPVPEPGTYALFLLGLAGIGVAARRRRTD